MYFIFTKDLVSTLIFSGFLLKVGIVLINRRLEKKHEIQKNFIYAAALFILIPALTINFIEYAGVTVWAHGLIFLLSP